MWRAAFQTWLGLVLALLHVPQGRTVLVPPPRCTQSSNDTSVTYKCETSNVVLSIEPQEVAGCGSLNVGCAADDKIQCYLFHNASAAQPWLAAKINAPNDATLLGGGDQSQQVSFAVNISEITEVAYLATNTDDERYSVFISLGFDGCEPAKPIALQPSQVLQPVIATASALTNLTLQHNNCSAYQRESGSQISCPVDTLSVTLEAAAVKSCTWLQLSSVSSADARFFLFPTASAAKTWRSASVNTPEIMGVDFLGGCQAATICTFSYRLEAIHGLLFLEASTNLPSPMEPLVNITIGCLANNQTPPALAISQTTPVPSPPASTLPSPDPTHAAAIPPAVSPTAAVAPAAGSSPSNIFPIPSRSSGGISSGAIGGIVGAIAALGLVLGLLTCCLVRRRRRRSAEVSEPDELTQPDGKFGESWSSHTAGSGKTSAPVSSNKLLTTSTDSLSITQGDSSVDPALPRLTDPAHVEYSGRELGRGAGGKVFSGLLYKTEPIAVKVLQHANWQAESATIFDEIDVMRKIRSAYLVQYLGACIKDGELLIMMELMKDSLARLLSQSDTGTGLYCWQRRGKHAALAAAHGLHHLHSQDHPILHRDIKAANVLVDAKGHVKLADFGLARVLTSPSIPGTDPHAVGGTFTHMAPELLSGQKARRSSDIWSFGMLLLEVVTMTTPRRRGDLCTADIRDMPPDLCPPDLTRLIVACQHENSDDRPTSLQLTQALRELCK